MHQGSEVHSVTQTQLSAGNPLTRTVHGEQRAQAPRVPGWLRRSCIGSPGARHGCIVTARLAFL